MPHTSLPDWRARIDPEADPPRLRGGATPVAEVLRELARGRRPEEVVRLHPALTLDDILACLEFAADRIDPASAKAIASITVARCLEPDNTATLAPPSTD